jgi:hypothetical protein
MRQGRQDLRHSALLGVGTRTRRPLIPAMAVLLAVATTLALSPLQVAGQQALPAAAALRVTPAMQTGEDDGSERGSGGVFLASALIPGAAQYLMGDDRWVPYIAVEAWALTSHVQQRRLARTLEARYRDVAWQVARRVSVGERRDTTFEYYEAMAKWSSSGGWMPDGTPERQADTFNGELWRLARALYFPGGQPAPPGSPAYEAAVQFYLSRAIPPAFAWAWGSSELEQQVFSDLITESDAAFRSASRYLGIIVANHVTSAVEALITSRLRQLSGGALRMETRPSRNGDGGFEYGVRIHF